MRSVAGAEGGVRKKNILLANKEMPGLPSITAYLLGLITPGFRTDKIVNPVFYIAKPRVQSSWDDLMNYFIRHPKGGEDNMLAAQLFIRDQPRKDRQMWEDILAKRYKLSWEQYLRHHLFNEEETNESTYFRFRNRDETQN